MSLYQKYRPRKLSEVAGHKKIVTELYNRQTGGGLPQAIYLTGESGTGKTTIARVIAMMANCEKGGKDPCMECESCLLVLAEDWTGPIKELNASNIDTESMRRLEEDANTPSFFGGKKVWIINEWQELSNNPKARKNCLSLLENENKNVHIIITSMDDSKTDNAIRNRCASFKIKPLTVEEIGEYLLEICDKEEIAVDTDKQEHMDVIVAIADAANGSMRQALAYIEKVHFANLWTLAEVQEELNIVSDTDLRRITMDIMNGNPSVLLPIPEKEVIEKVKWFVLNVYRATKGACPAYEMKKIGNVAEQVTSERAATILKFMDELFSRPYIDHYAIGKFLVDCVESKNSKGVQPIDRQVNNVEAVVKVEEKPKRVARQPVKRGR